jgi:hypothetical protein
MHDAPRNSELVHRMRGEAGDGVMQFGQILATPPAGRRSECAQLRSGKVAASFFR